MWSFFADDDGNKRGQTSRPVVGAEIQRHCNFETHLYHRGYRLGFMFCRLFKHHSWSAYNLFLWRGLDTDTTFTAYFTRLVHKDFSHSQTSSGTSTRSYSTTAEPTKCTEHGAIQRGSAQCTVGTVSISCLLYTILYGGIVVSYSTTYSSHLVITRGMAIILVYFNLTLNPFLYCWKISEVRRGMKLTIRQALCCPWS